VLLSGGLTLEDLHASGRLAEGRGQAVAELWEQVLTWRSMIRMRTDLPLPAAP
jgi:DNA polymerase-1